MKPKPGEHGDQRHLEWGSIRFSVARAMRIVVEATGLIPDQYRALLAGVPVELTREQVASLVPPDRRPANTEEHAVWVLTGDSTLEPVA